MEPSLSRPAVGCFSTQSWNGAAIAYAVKSVAWAPVAQGIEHSPPERGAQVRILPGAPSGAAGSTVLLSSPRGAQVRILPGARSAAECPGFEPVCSTHREVRRFESSGGTVRRRFGPYLTNRTLQSNNDVGSFWRKTQPKVSVPRVFRTILGSSAPNTSHRPLVERLGPWRFQKPAGAPV